MATRNIETDQDLSHQTNLSQDRDGDEPVFDVSSVGSISVTPLKPARKNRTDEDQASKEDDNKCGLLKSILVATLIIVMFYIILGFVIRDQREPAKAPNNDKKYNDDSETAYSCSANSFMIGDGICDDVTNIRSCLFDDGDCCQPQGMNNEASALKFCQQCSCKLEVDLLKLKQDLSEMDMERRDFSHFSSSHKPADITVTDSVFTKVANMSTCSRWCLDLMSATEESNNKQMFNAWHLDNSTGSIKNETKKCSCLHLSVCTNPYEDWKSQGKASLETLLTPGAVLLIAKDRFDLNQNCSFCPKQEEPLGNLMVIAGTGVGYLAEDAEVVSLTSSKKCNFPHNLDYAKTGCYDKEYDIEYSLEGAVGGLLNCSSLPVVCGGSCINTEYFSSTCQTLSNSSILGNLTLSVEMSTPRVDAASIVINTGSDTGRLWITGGTMTISNSWTYLATTEFISFVPFGPGGIGPHLHVEQGPELVEAVKSHCMINVNDQTALLIGGHRFDDKDETDQVWTFDLRSPPDDTKWQQGPSLLAPRFSHACSLIKDKATGNRLVIVVGGEGPIAQSVEMTNIDGNPTGNFTLVAGGVGDTTENIFGVYRLTHPFGIATEDRSSFVFGGGDDQMVYRDLWIVSCRNGDCSIERRENILDFGRSDSVALLIPQSSVPCDY